MVVTDLPAISEICVWHENARSPLMCTMHAPHKPAPQPNLVPVSFKSSRITQQWCLRRRIRCRRPAIHKEICGHCVLPGPVRAQGPRRACSIILRTRRNGNGQPMTRMSGLRDVTLYPPKTTGHRLLAKISGRLFEISNHFCAVARIDLLVAPHHSEDCNQTLGAVNQRKCNSAHPW